MAGLSFGTGMYSPRVAARIAHIRYQNFQAWAKANLIRPTKVKAGASEESIYTYRDLLLMRLISRLRDQGVRAKEIRAALDTIALMSEGDKDAWMRATILVSDGVVVALLPGMTDWNPVAVARGPQKMAVVFFPDLIENLKNELVPPTIFPNIEVNPEVLGGAPVVKGTRITTRAVVEVRESGEDPRLAYPRLTPDQVAEAEAYEKFLHAA